MSGCICAGLKEKEVFVTQTLINSMRKENEFKPLEIKFNLLWKKIFKKFLVICIVKGVPYSCTLYFWKFCNILINGSQSMFNRQYVPMLSTIL